MHQASSFSRCRWLKKLSAIFLFAFLKRFGFFGSFGFIIGPLILVNSIKIIEEAIESGAVIKKR